MTSNRISLRLYVASRVSNTLVMQTVAAITVAGFFVMGIATLWALPDIPAELGGLREEVQWFEISLPDGSYSFVLQSGSSNNNDQRDSDNNDRRDSNRNNNNNNAPPPPLPVDSDGDGLTDDQDRCPNTPGTYDYNGCPPDADGDSIPDASDSCPTIPGVAGFGGCPPPTPTPMLPAMPTTGDCVLAPRTSQSVNVREEPTTSASISDYVPYNLMMPVLGKTVNDDGEEWVMVERGWVSRSVIRLGGNCALLPQIVSNIQITYRPSEDPELNALLAVFQAIPTENGQSIVYLVDQGVQPLPQTLTDENAFPEINPTGTLIAYLSRESEGLVTLHIFDRNANVERLAYTGSGGYTVGWFPMVWMPGGSSVLLTLLDASLRPGIFVVDSDVPGEIAPIALVDYGTSPAISPDGTYIAYEAETENKHVIRVDVIESRRSTIVSRSRECFSPTFGQDSESVYFACNENETVELYRYDRLGLAPMNLDIVPLDVPQPIAAGVFSLNDGQSVYLYNLRNANLTPILETSSATIMHFRSVVLDR